MRPTLLVLCACSPSLAPEGAPESASRDEADPTLPMDLLPPPGQPLVLTAEVPHPGGVVHLAVTNADPGENVRWYVSSGGIAPGPCPAQYGGLCLDLGGGTLLLGASPADAAGAATWVMDVPPSMTVGSRITFQAVARRGNGGAASVKSNAVPRTVGDPAWAHTVAVDGDLADWGADELFATTSGSGQGGVTWDAATLYVAFQHPDVAAGGALHWQLVYLSDGGPGSTTPPGLGTQAPAVPFAATHVIRRKADGSYDDLHVWDDLLQAWVQTAWWLGTAGSAAAEGGDVLELAIPRDQLGDSVVDVILASAYEGAGFESTYAGVPSDAFVDGYDPDPTTSLLLDLSLPDPAVTQNP